MEADRWLGLDLRHLIALKAIADEGSFGRAAEKLGYTQSAISQQIAALERIVGLRLIERPGGPRPISLTEAGQILLRHADAIQARLLAAKADMSALEAGDAGRLRVGTFQSVGAKIIPRLLRRFSESHPQVEVVLRESQDESELLEMIERGDLDLTFWTLPVRRAVRDGRAPARPLCARRSRRLAARGAQADPDPEGDRAPAAHRLQPLQRDGARRSAAPSTGRAPNYVFRSDNNGTVQGLVGAGVGISVSPRLTVDEDDPIDRRHRPPRAHRAPRHRPRLALTIGTAAQRRRRSSTPRSPSAASSRPSPQRPESRSVQSRRRPGRESGRLQGSCATGVSALADIPVCGKLR